ncbi:MAG: FtsW/RodA/SpoVE family cell cycle protein [Ilumatobacteraceae bacterium]
MTSLLQRRPDSGLGNIRSSASAPSRNIDWLLLGAQALICAIGLATVYSASYSKVKGDDSPFVFVQRQEIFMILAVILMVVVMSVDYDLWRERAAMFYVGTIMLLMLVIAVGAVSGGARLSFDLGPFNVQPAEFAKVTLLMSLSAYLAEERAPRDQLRPVQRWPGAHRHPGRVDHRPAGPRLGLGDHRHRHGRAPGGRGPLQAHCPHHRPGPDDRWRRGDRQASSAAISCGGSPCS